MAVSQCARQEHLVRQNNTKRNAGTWPSGKAPASGAGDRRFDPYRPSHAFILMKKVVISGSVRLQQGLKKWNQRWLSAGFDVIYLPELIDHDENFTAAYKDTYRRLYKSLLRTDVLFVMNENKHGVDGYVGAQTFAEASYAVANNLILNNRKICIVLLNMPSKQVASYSEITIWLELGWVVLFDDWKQQAGF